MSGIAPKKDTGWKALQRENKFNFTKWGEYMKRAHAAEKKVEELERINKIATDFIGYARHGKTCWWLEVEDRTVCECGLSEVRKKLEREWLKKSDG